MRSRILTLDQALFLASNRIRAGQLKRFEFLLRGMSHLGDGYLWIALLIVALTTGRTKAAFAGLVAAALASGFSLFLKHTCRRTRPSGATNWGRFVAPDKYSFPSGHTTTAFALATVTVTQWSTISPALWICAGCIAASRALLGCHYLSDVVAGAGLGVLSGVLAGLIIS